MVSKDTADAFNPKVVRSTMGAIFRVKIIECEDLKQTLKEVQKHNFKLVVTSLQTSKSFYDVDYSKKVIIIGNEANGVEKQIQDIADYKVKIPMLGKTESLNAAVSTGIMLYEYVRQKIATGSGFRWQLFKIKIDKSTLRKVCFWSNRTRYERNVKY